MIAQFQVNMDFGSLGVSFNEPIPQTSSLSLTPFLPLSVSDARQCQKHGTDFRLNSMTKVLSAKAMRGCRERSVNRKKPRVLDVFFPRTVLNGFKGYQKEKPAWESKSRALGGSQKWHQAVCLDVDPVLINPTLQNA